VVRLVRGLKGRVAMRSELVVRFDYGSIVPWVSRLPDGRVELIAGPDRLTLHTLVPLRGENMRTVGEFTVEAGQETEFVLSWNPSHCSAPPPQRAAALLERVDTFWSNWVASLQIMYGICGERRLTEYEVPWLPGYQGSAPVRIGNQAAEQLQLDVYGEVLDALYVARRAGLSAESASWAVQTALVEHLEAIWQQPDDGIWEVRGGRKHFTHSKVMAWVAFDRAVRSIEEFGLEGPLERWRGVREQIHRDVCERGFDTTRNCFVQYYGSGGLDASLLLIAIVGFLPPEDPRVVGTVAAIERDLVRDGLVLRYDTGGGADGLPPGEGAFLACSFWLADNYILQGRLEEARSLFERLLALRNDVGLLAEEYDPRARRQLGNFPQAFSHLALLNTAHNLMSACGPARQRAGGTAAASCDGRAAPAVPSRSHGA
jgi:GH15 family glucan-1,4-alpha-glucosidase